VNAEVNVSGGSKKKGILSGIKGKIEEVKKNYWKPQQIDEKFL
jgi:hypothetical protein